VDEVSGHVIVPIKKIAKLDLPRQGGNGTQAKPLHAKCVHVYNHFCNALHSILQTERYPNNHKHPLNVLVMAMRVSLVLVVAAAVSAFAAAEVSVQQLSTGFEGDKPPAGKFAAASWQ
jgi:hypothetical protein